MNKEWFTVDRKGLAALQEGKPKAHLVRELIQNAFDEDITRCALTMEQSKGKAVIIMEDNSPVGFRDLSDSYTLFKDTPKRRNAEQRGRFNLGEKQVFSLASKAQIITTTGGMLFDDKGRHTLRRKREQGSEITVWLRMNQEEYQECLDYVNTILVPRGINFRCIDKNTSYSKAFIYQSPHKELEATLKTEIERDGAMKPSKRKTKVYLHEANGAAYVYEMGLPICEIECQYNIDVQQKVPMSADRDKVSQAFLKELFAEVLNITHDEIEKEDSSDNWIRIATTSDRIEGAAVRDIVKKRHGEKSLVWNPSDMEANDEAISHGFHTVRGNEYSAEEWANIRKHDALPSTSAKFGKNRTGDPIVVEPNENQKKIAEFAKKVARDFLGINLSVEFLGNMNTGASADFQIGGSHLRFMVRKIAKEYWDIDKNGHMTQQILDLIIHEFGHNKGFHYESSYHKCLTMLGSSLALKALAEPEYFKL